ncbi:MAG: SEL1-like repeat protein [Alphaproteobacteria bacterium]|nr:SEL1-like repeat protein [Alphaproteobacteria bacterium]MDE2112836.1 SEL1-like repeat protein [Alphaproteobacteria bacterium]MDE2492853.1 SEL1-like repeat protein [Alphaproteobacteria bacterium]
MSGRRGNTSAVATAKPRWCRPREREATRLAILDATQRLINAHGPDALTLSAIADEAGLARATLYGYFSSKRQLLAQLNGEEVPEPSASPDEQVTEEEDLQAEVIPEPPAEAEPQRRDSEPEPEDIAEPPAAKEEIPEAAQPAPNHIVVEPSGDETKTAGASSGVSDNGADYAAAMRLQAEELDRLAKRVIVPKSMVRDGTDIVITRLEGRVRMIEKTVTDLEARHGQDAKDLSDRIDAAMDAVRQLQRRLEDANGKHQLALAEVRLDVHNLANAGNSAVAKPAAFCAEPAADLVEPVLADADTPTSEPSAMFSYPDEPVSEAIQRAYLSSARRAAIEAVQQASTRDNSKAAAWQAKWPWLLGILILAAATLGAVIGTRHHAPIGDRANSRESRQSVAQPTDGQGTTFASDRLAAMAAGGNATAQLILGIRLLNGAGMAINIEKAAIWLQHAAENGQPVAQESLGVLYQTGTGVVADMSKAVHWYEAAARHGNVKAMANLAKVYAGGSGEAADFTKAVQWFTRAAKLGDVDSQFDLAVLFERGEGANRSLTNAYAWYSIAAKQGDRDAAGQAVIIAAQLSPQELLAAKKAVADFRPAPIDHRANDMPTTAGQPGRRR